ncbi:MAG TPA: lipopolysaccharide biosynthesis protein [Polyangiaceae bacterium]|nr:lipopolysaccharide biosynthesis protein [Polyangiaceae bacterium]
MDAGRAYTSDPSPQAGSPPAPPAGDDAARTAGRGGAAVAGAKLYFLLIGLVQKTLLPQTWVLGVEGYGALARVLTIVNVANNVVTGTCIQGASRAVAQAPPGGRRGVERGLWRLHAALALPLGLLVALLGPLAARLTGGAHVAGLVRASALIVFAYALYAPVVGVLNGRRSFGRQAALDVTYATMRTLALVGGALLVGRLGGSRPAGALGGFVLAAALIVPLSFAAARVGPGGAGAAAPGGAAGAPGGRLETKPYLAFLAPLALGQLFLNALMQADIWLLGRFSDRAAVDAGLAGAEAIAASDRSVAIYNACQLFSFLPYQLLFAITFILFPMLAKAHADGDREAVARYVRTGVRLAGVLAGAMVAVTFGLAPQLLRLVFPPAISDHGGEALRLLALGQGAFALFGVQTTVLSSVHRERWTLVLNGAATLVVAGLNLLLVPGAAVGAPIAERTALATALAMALAVAAGGAAVVRATGALVRPLAALRVLAAFALAAFVGTRLPQGGKALTVASAALVGLVYAAALVATRELGPGDLALVRRVLGRRG